MAEFRQSLVHFSMALARSVLLWRRCDMLCTSGFADDVMFSYHGANHGPESSMEFARWRYQLDVRQVETTTVLNG